MNDYVSIITNTFHKLFMSNRGGINAELQTRFSTLPGIHTLIEEGNDKEIQDLVFLNIY